MQTLAELLSAMKVKRYKTTKDGLVAIRKAGQWHYFRMDAKDGRYTCTGSTLTFQD